MIAEYNGSDTLLRKFVYGPGIDELICMIDVDGQTKTRYYYHYDGLGSVIALSNTNGDIVEAYSYDVFGTPTIYTAAGADGLWRTGDDTTTSVSAIGNPYMFTARRYDDETGLYYYRARMYAPDLGRFMQTDPIGYADGINWYAYCGNNPVNWIDPSGQDYIYWTPGGVGFPSEYQRIHVHRDIRQDPELIPAYEYLKSNYPELCKGNPNLIVADIPWPGVEGLGGLGNNTAYVDVEQIKRQWGEDAYDHIVRGLSHELMHTQDGFLKTLVGNLTGRHDEIYEESENIRREYLRDRRQNKNKEVSTQNKKIKKQG